MPDKPLASQLQMLRCQVEAGAYAFDAARVKAIHRWVSVAAQSGGDGSIGELSGRPVYPLARLLGFGEESGAASNGPVLLLDEFAIQVDKVSRPAQVAVSALRRLPHPAESAHEYVSGLVRLDGALTLLLDPERLRESDGSIAKVATVPHWPADEPWRNTVSDGQQRVAEKTDRLLCFLPPTQSSGGQSEQTYLAVSYRQAVEVAQGLTLSRLRSREPWLAGLVDWRERAVPVVDVAGLLGLEPSRNTNVSRVLIARSPRSGELFAFPATHLAPLQLPLSDDTTVVKTIDPPSAFVRAAYELAEGYLFLPDLEKLTAGLSRAS